ncbi:vacuolar protein sorting-associated protein 11 homolog [Clytia hemisphaerica]|uniref:Vacuolar protein sorting-associated protein 11 homolog n=1 Tax=Clytia hemisphaerica TaxID=252671 RepID=A0A7M5UWY9_9CNID
MAFSQWRKFNFFDREILKDPVSKGNFEHLKNITPSCHASGRGIILFGDVEGYLHQLSRELDFKSFKIYELSVSHLFQLKQHSILVTVGEDEVGVNPMIKVWNFDKINPSTGNPTCVRMLRALAGNRAVQVSSIAVHENLSQMAVGFVDGTVTIIKGDITNSRHSKARTIHEDKYPITGLAFKQVGNKIVLFVSTTEAVLSFNVTSKDHKETLAEFGAGVGCSAISDVAQDNMFIIANPDALYFFHTDSMGPCFAFEGEKKMICWFRGYLVVVSKEMKQLPRTSGTAMGMNVLSIYDIENKFIAYSAPFPDVIAVLGEWGSLHVVTGDGKVFQLEEKDTQTKLETLFRKNMYDMAISLAKSQHYSDGLIEIFRQYGDHLYSKGNHDGAIQQYIRTIGHLEPSYVIRKFLDAQRIHNLTEYLQALHEKGLANTDHTTLLLNCYTKLKSVEKLNDFIHTDNELNFDVETAIRVCRQANYFEHALELAEKFDQHEWYLKIQLEDNKDYAKALNYMKRLKFLEAEANLKSYGKLLMESVPDETTEFLKQLCTDYRPIEVKKKAEKQDVAPSTTNGTTSNIGASLVSGTINMESVTPPRRIERSHPDDFIHIFVHQRPKLKEFLQHMVKERNDCSNVTYNTLLELYLHDASVANSNKEYEKGAVEENKALSLLTNAQAKYDLDHAMVLSQMHNFKRGILFLYEKAKSYQLILRYHMDHEDYDAIIEDCKNYGVKDASLWSQALAYFASKEEACKSHIIDVLNHIDKINLMSPLHVIETLAHNSTATLGVVKDYIIRRLQQENEQIAKDERMIRKYREDTEKMRSQIEELQTCAKIFQSSKCMICSRPLELPAVHFLCGDSFHQACFESYAESENECPVCTPENRKVMDIIRSQENNTQLHEQFNKQIEKAPDGFAVVADYFGRGVFNKVTLYTDSKTQQPMLPVDPQKQRQTLFE